MAECACGNYWRIVATDLASGRERKRLHPTAADWQTVLNEVGTGTLTFATREVTARDLWPGLTAIYILRIAGGTASGREPVVEFAGLVDAYDAQPGTTRVGLKSLEHYWWRRHLDTTEVFDSVSQNQIAKALVDRTNSNGIPLFGQADGSIWIRDRTYEGYERKVIGDAIEELTQVQGGPDWELVHSKVAGAWRTTAIFRDYVGVDRGLDLVGDRQAQSYALRVDGSQQATHVDAIGAGEEQDQLIEPANDSSGIYPRFDAAPAWKDVNQRTTLKSHAEGYLEDHQEPVAIPQVSVAGLDPDPSQYRNGDTIGVKFDNGAAVYQGLGRIVSTSWNLGVGQAPTRTYELLPITRASQSVLNLTPSHWCENGDC